MNSCNIHNLKLHEAYFADDLGKSATFVRKEFVFYHILLEVV